MIKKRDFTTKASGIKTGINPGSVEPIYPATLPLLAAIWSQLLWALFGGPFFAISGL